MPDFDVKEKRFEQDIEEYLLTYGGYEKGDSASFNREKALDINTFLTFIRTSQPKQWERFEKIYGADSERQIIDRFCREVKMVGLLKVLRQGFTDRGIKFVESIIKCRRNRYGFSCIIFLSEGRRKEVKTLNGYSYLTLEQRREIERMYAEGERVVDIAARLKRSAAAIYEELKRGYTGEFDGYARPKYSADLAQATVQENFRRRGNRRGANC